MLNLYKFKWDVGRGYEAEGVFVADEKEVEAAMGKTADFGEICGKHSEISIDLKPEYFTVISTDRSFIEKILEVFGGKTVSGHNPLKCIRCEKCGEFPEYCGCQKP
jgi:hypothetical protein